MVCLQLHAVTITEQSCWLHAAVMQQSLRRLPPALYVLLWLLVCRRHHPCQARGIQVQALPTACAPGPSGLPCCWCMAQLPQQQPHEDHCGPEAAADVGFPLAAQPSGFLGRFPEGRGPCCIPHAQHTGELPTLLPGQAHKAGCCCGRLVSRVCAMCAQDNICGSYA